MAVTVPLTFEEGGDAVDEGFAPDEAVGEIVGVTEGLTEVVGTGDDIAVGVVAEVQELVIGIIGGGYRMGLSVGGP